MAESLRSKATAGARHADSFIPCTLHSTPSLLEFRRIGFGEIVSCIALHMLKPDCMYLIVGLGRDGKKRVLACITKSGRENLEDWKRILGPH